jgi:hypothetical protein
MAWLKNVIQNISDKFKSSDDIAKRNAVPKSDFGTWPPAINPDHDGHSKWPYQDKSPNPVVGNCSACGLCLYKNMMYYCSRGGECPSGLGGSRATL